MAAWESYLTENESRFTTELIDFLRIPSVSSLPEHAGDVQRAAEWVADKLQATGMGGVKVMPTGGHPVVYGEWLHAPGQQTILIYGHFDVQPVDPLDLWTNPPFEPVIKENQVYARGASDDKGNLLLAIVAVEALLKTAGRLPVNLKFLVEGQEEIGSPQLPAFVAADRELLASDLVLNADGGQWSERHPALLEGLRGICSIQIDVRGANADLHSGVFAGAIQNPLHALAELIASMHTREGKVAVEGFYDDVAIPTPAERARVAAMPFRKDTYKAQIGVEEIFGEPGYTTSERTWVRPTLEVNGMWGGFQGEGTKTVLPREAHAKISCRLVPNQESAKISDLLEAHVQKHTPKGVKVTVRRGEATARPYLMPVDHPSNEAARAVLVELYGKEPYYIRSGGSVPICEILLQHLGAYSISFGFGLSEDQVHAPDEFFSLDRFKRGQVAYAMMLEKLAEWKGQFDE